MRSISPRSRALVRYTLPVLLGVAGAVHAANFTVTSTAGDGPGSLRAAMTSAQSTANPPHSIVFSLPPNSVIALVAALPSANNVALTIDGSATANLTIDGQDTGRIFVQGAASPLTLRNLTLRRGFAFNGNGACVLTSHSTTPLVVDGVTFSGCRAISVDAGIAARGGAISAAGDVSIRRSVLIDNIAQSSLQIASGGAVHATRNVLIEESFLDGNRATGGGGFSNVGGALAAGPGSISLLRNRWIGNRADNSSTPTSAFGGAIYARNDSTLTVRQSLFVDNEAPNGAALYAGTLSTGVEMGIIASNNTIAGNRGGPALFLQDSRIDLKNNSFWKNATRTGYGAHLTLGGQATRITAVSNNLFAVSEAAAPLCSTLSVPADLLGTGYNLFTDSSCGSIDNFSLITSDPLHIRAVRRTGSAFNDIPVLDLRADSPAIDNGNPDVPGSATAFACTAGDARDEDRPSDGDADGVATCDIGALELQREASLFAEDFDSVLLR